MKTLYIIRGLPGSGKSTLAKQLAGENVCEADEFFMRDDVYEFDPKFLGPAHTFCQVKCKNLMNKEVEIIAVSNTSSRRWEFFPYLELAKVRGYRVVEITMTGELYANVHQVPSDKIEEMRARWEK